MTLSHWLLALGAGMTSQPSPVAGTPYIGSTTLPGADGAVWIVFRQS